MTQSARSRAMALRCRNRGGDCPCGDECQADSEADRGRMFAVMVPVEAITPKAVRPDWRRPDPPEGDYELVAVDTGEGWSLCWESESTGDVVDVVGAAAWPFVEDAARASDWRALGIDVG